MADEAGSIPVAELEAERSRDALVAIRSAVALGTSLVLGWSVALLVRLWLPRHLGAAAFGGYSLAEGFAAACFVPLGLGVDTYVQKEIPTRPEHASDFFGGIVVARLAMSAVLCGVLVVALGATGKPADVREAAIVFGAAQLAVATGGTLAALLQAARAVGGLAVVNVAAKVAWGAGIVVAAFAGGRLVALAAAFALAEVLRAVWLWRLARRHLALRWEVALRPVAAVVRSSLPFYLNAVAIVLYAKADVTLLAILTSDVEVGWYSAASNLAGLALLLTPLLGSVLTPLLSRSAARSPDELVVVLRRATSAVLAVAIPVSLFMSLGADVWIRIALGPAFAPATASLRVLGPMFIVTYLSIIGATANVLLGRAWTVTGISVVGLALNLGLNLAIVPLASRALGPGGAGVGAAAVLLATDGAVTAAFLALLGRSALDRDGARLVLKSVAACAAAAVADRALAGLGDARVVVAFVAYALVVTATGAVRPRRLLAVAVEAIASRRNRALA